MSQFVNVNPSFSPDQNFWELNPQLIYITPFSKAWKIDEGGDESSKLMWCTYFLSDPDEEHNKFYRMGPDKIKTTLKENYYPDIDWDDKLLNELLEAYPQICLSSIQRAVKESIDFLERRMQFIRNAVYNYETMKELDNAASKNTKLLEDHEKLEQKFLQSKSSARLKAGRRQSKPEKGEV